MGIPKDPLRYRSDFERYDNVKKMSNSSREWGKAKTLWDRRYGYNKQYTNPYDWKHYKSKQ